MIDGLRALATLIEKASNFDGWISGNSISNLNTSATGKREVYLIKSKKEEDL